MREEERQSVAVCGGVKRSEAELRRGKGSGIVRVLGQGEEGGVQESGPARVARSPAGHVAVLVVW